MNNLNYNSSEDQKREAANAVFEKFSDFLFEKVNLINSAGATSGATTSTTSYVMALRVIDTSVRNFFKPDRKIRFRCSFYLTQPTKADAYILVPATIDSITTPTSVTDLVNYVGIKILSGALSLVAKYNGLEKTISVGLPITTDTYYLEIQYNITSADFFINGNRIGSINCDMSENTYTYQTFYPLIAPIRSTDATSVNMTMESYQILQEK